MRIKVFALDAATGNSKWHFSQGKDYVELPAGAALRHVSLANGLLYVTSSSGQLFVLNAASGEILFKDQTIDLNETLGLGLSKPHHASMNSGAIISQGMVYVPYGAQNNPSGGLIAYELNRRPVALSDLIWVADKQPIIIDALRNDRDPNGDALQFVSVSGTAIDLDDGEADVLPLEYGTVQVFNPGDDAAQPNAAYLKFTPNNSFRFLARFNYQVADIAPMRRVNGVELNEPEPTHTPRYANAAVWLLKAPKGY
jgi:hypothetical protein